MAVTQNDVAAALATVRDPASGASVIEAGVVQGLAVRDSHVSFALEIPPARAREYESVRKACEDAVNALPGVLSVAAVLTAHRAPESKKGHAHPPQPTNVTGINAIIAVASGKGGVGKSTVAVNLAVALARLGHKTGLLDADIYGPSVPRLLAIHEKPQSDGKKLQPIEKFGIKAMSIGFIVPEDDPVIWRGPMVQGALTQMLNDVAWAPLDILVIDMPPGTGDAQLTIAQRVALKGAIIVSTPQDIALADARKGLAMFRKTHVPILGIVENMSMFICPNCGHESHIFGHGGARETAAKLDAPFLGEIPLVPSIRETSDSGAPITASQPESAEAKAFLALAQTVATSIAAPQRAAPRIVME